MKLNWKACLVAGAVLAGISGTAAARDHVNFSLSFGVPAPVYVAPAPAYYAPPAPVYYAPPPAPVYYEPAYYSPAPGFYDRWGRWHPYRHHPRRHW